jgi:pre-mRNA-splicing factor SYF1
MVVIYRRYLTIDPSVTEHYTSLLLSASNPSPRPLEAAKLFLSLARKAARGEYVSPEGKSPYQLLGDWLDIVEQYAEDVGLDIEETLKSTEEHKRQDEEQQQQQSENQNSSEPASISGKLIRFDGPPIDVSADGKPLSAYDEDEDPASTRKLNVERIVNKDGLAVYKDQAGRLWTGLATYWIKRGEFDRAKATFEAGMISVLTIRDFTQIFDAYAEFSESVISAMMEALATPDEDEDEEETETELDGRMKEFEELMDRRPFLVNDVLLRRNPNDVQEWEKRVAMWGADDEKVQVHVAHDEMTLTYLCRSQRHTHKPYRPPILGKLLPTFIDCISTLPNSMKKVASKAKQSLTSTVPVKYSKGPRKSTSRLSKIWLRYGVNGLKWKFVTSRTIFYS